MTPLYALETYKLLLHTQSVFERWQPALSVYSIKSLNTTYQDSSYHKVCWVFMGSLAVPVKPNKQVEALVSGNV